NTTNNGNSAPITIHASNVTFGDQATLLGSSITIDDNGFAIPGLILTSNGSANIFATTGALSIRSAGPLEFTGNSFYPDGSSVNVTSATGIIFDQFVRVQGSPSTTNPNLVLTFTAPQLAFSDGSLLINLANNSGAITIHTNLLSLGDGSNSNQVTIWGDAITIDDRGISTGGLQITAFNTGGNFVENEIQSIGNLTIATTNGGLFFTSTDTTQTASLSLDAGNALTISASTNITIDQNVFVTNQVSVGSWTVSSPLITFNDGSALVVNANSATQTLTINTNSLVLNNGAINSSPIQAGALTISDSGMPLSGLTIHVLDGTSLTFGNSASTSVSISPVGPLSIIGSSPNAGSAIALFATGSITLSSHSEITIGQNMTLNGGAGGSWTITAPTLTLADGSTIDNSADAPTLAI